MEPVNVAEPLLRKILLGAFFTGGGGGGRTGLGTFSAGDVSASVEVATAVLSDRCAFCAIDGVSGEGLLAGAAGAESSPLCAKIENGLSKIVCFTCSVAAASSSAAPCK